MNLASASHRSPRARMDGAPPCLAVQRPKPTQKSRIPHIGYSLERMISFGEGDCL